MRRNLVHKKDQEILSNQRAVKVKMDQKKLKIVLEVLSQVYRTSPIKQEYIEKSLLEIYSREHLTVEELFFVCFGFIGDGCLYFWYVFNTKNSCFLKDLS